MHRILTTSVADVYPHYVAKVARKGRFKAELDQVVEWLTGYDQPALQERLETGTTFEAFFADAQLNPNASSITGVVCGVRVEHTEDPLMKKIPYLDKLVDELAKARPIEKVLGEGGMVSGAGLLWRHASHAGPGHAGSRAWTLST